MKIKFYLFALLLTILFAGCDKYEGNTFDFSNSLPNYVEFASVKGLTVKPGAKASFRIITRSSFFKDTQVSVKIDGNGFNETKTTVLPKMKTSVDDNFTIPVSATVGADFTITILSAHMEGAEVRLGRIDSKTTVIKGKVIAP